MVVALLQDTFQDVARYGDAFAAAFYTRLFARFPEIVPFFAEVDLKVQHSKLMVSLIMVIEHLNYPEVLGPALRALGERHTTLAILPHHYEQVGAALLETLQAYLEPRWTPQVAEAWTDAYATIVTLMVPSPSHESTSSRHLS